jgi:2-polyprenyl-6-methoxyphenol hydroxylase-like FAD-dependent oxidoreductase
MQDSCVYLEAWRKVAMTDPDVPVLIVGGGTVGLSAAAFLAHHGVPATVVERRAGLSIHPRAIGVGVRTMELLRGIGLEQTIRHAAAGLANKGGWVTVETLAGADLPQRAAQQPVPPSSPDASSPFSPTQGIACAQDVLDAVLWDDARRHGATLHCDSELVALAQDADGVTAQVARRESGETRAVRAAYVIAADGAESFARRALGIPTSGAGAMGPPLINMLFEADLGPLVGDHPFTLCEVRTPAAPGMFIRVRDRHRWVFHCTYDPAQGQRPEDFSPERCQEIVRAAIGVPDLAVEILSILPWQVAALLADRFQEGRVFLIGDAAHVVPPTGGYGMNTGIADAHNLAWKLALALGSHDDPALLATYERERRPVAQFTLDQSLLRMTHPQLHFDPTRAAERVALGIASPEVVQLGYRYPTTATAAPAAIPPSLQDLALDLDASPGTRLPHAWIEHYGNRISTLDLIVARFTLLTGPEGQRWCEAADAIGRKAGIDLAAYRIGPDGDAIDRDGHACASLRLRGNDALLVRMDGFIAWRATAPEPEPERAIEQAIRHVVNRSRCIET